MPFFSFFLIGGLWQITLLRSQLFLMLYIISDCLQGLLDNLISYTAEIITFSS